MKDRSENERLIAKKRDVRRVMGMISEVTPPAVVIVTSMTRRPERILAVEEVRDEFYDKVTQLDHRRGRCG